MSEQLTMFNMYEHNFNNTLINVASVPQRSPFRYPGGKTWLIPVVRKWLRQDGKLVERLFEPFVGGGIVSLTAAFERMAENIYMYEIDEEISAVWYSILNGKNKWLADKILTFNLTSENIKTELNNSKKEQQDIFSTPHSIDHRDSFLS